MVINVVNSDNVVVDMAISSGGVAVKIDVVVHSDPSTVVVVDVVVVVSALTNVGQPMLSPSLIVLSTGIEVVLLVDVSSCRVIVCPCAVVIASIVDCVAIVVVVVVFDGDCNVVVSDFSLVVTAPPGFLVVDVVVILGLPLL